MRLRSSTSCETPRQRATGGAIIWPIPHAESSDEPPLTHLKAFSLGQSCEEPAFPLKKSSGGEGESEASPEKSPRRRRTARKAWGVGEAGRAAAQSPNNPTPLSTLLESNRISPQRRDARNEKDEIFISLSALPALITPDVLFHGGGRLRLHILISSGGESCNPGHRQRLDGRLLEAFIAFHHPHLLGHLIALLGRYSVPGVPQAHGSICRARTGPSSDGIISSSADT